MLGFDPLSGLPISGLPAVGGTGSTLTCDAGSYTLTGVAALLGPGINAAAGSYVLTGVGANLGPGIVASAGAYTLTGQPANLGPGLNAAVGAYAISGVAATLFYARGINAEAGAYNLTGYDAQLDSTSIPAAPSVAGYLTARKKRRYWVEIEGQTYHGSLAEVQGYVVGKAKADATSNTVAVPTIAEQKPSRASYPIAQANIKPMPSLLENNTSESLQQLYLDTMERLGVVIAQQEAYDVALLQHWAEMDDEEALIALLH